MPHPTALLLYGDYLGYHEETESEVYCLDGWLYSLREEFNHKGEGGQYVISRFNRALAELS